MDPTLLRSGMHGPVVRELQERLTSAGFTTALDGTFDAATERAVRGFQDARGLLVDGICGPETWGALVESSYRLGDRLLYLRRPMLRGDDVAELQRRLNGLGFDAGREDGILGPETEAAIRQFQRNAGLTPDGIFGPQTEMMLRRVDALAGGDVAAVRERELLRRGPHRLTGRKVYLAVEPGLDALGSTVAKGLHDAGATVVSDFSGQNDSVLATEANRFGADLFLAIRAGEDRRCTYFATNAFRSEAGFCVAEHLDAELRVVLGSTAGATGRSYPVLRETRMAAVVCEVVARDDATALQALVAKGPAVADAIVRGTRRGVERPLDSPC